MRLTVLLFSLHTCLGAMPASIAPKPAGTPAGTPVSSYPKPHLRFKERTGTMGFVYGALLGPVGYFGVKIFSRHSEVMQYQAGRGFKLWGMVVASCLILAGCAALKDNGDLGTNLLTAMWTAL